MIRAPYPWAFAAVAVLALSVAAGPAMAAPADLAIDTEVRLGYDVNPFLSTGNDVSAPFVKASIHPKLTKADGQGQVTVDGYYDRTEYLKNYGGVGEYGGQLAVQRRLTPKLSLFAALSYDSEVVGLGDDQVTGQPADSIDVNLIGTRRRSDTFSANGGWEYQASSKDTITASGGYSKIVYDGPGDSSNIGGTLGWKHAISARTKIGLRGSVYRIDYDQPGLSTMIMQPTVTFSTQLSATWNLDLSLGMSFSDLSVPAALGGDRNAKGLAGTAQLCHTGTRDNLCVFGDRSVSASGVGGTTEQTQIGVNYRRSLAERLGFTWNGSYAHSKSQLATVGTRQYVSGRAGLDWAVSPTIKIGAEGRYRDVFGQGAPVKADIGGDVYAKIQFLGR